MKLYSYSLTPTVVCEDFPIKKVTEPSHVLEVMKNAFDDLPEQEQFWVIFLNRAGIVKGRMRLTIGTQTAALASPKEILRAALLANACSFICVHNHPSGECTPSGPDINVTRLIRDASKAIDLAFHDHVIVGDKAVDPLGKGYYSFREAGFI